MLLVGTVTTELVVYQQLQVCQSPGPQMLSTTSPTEALVLTPAAVSLNHFDCRFNPLQCLIIFTLSIPSTIPTYTLQALEGAPSDQLMQQSQMPQYYSQQPWVSKSSASSLSAFSASVLLLPVVPLSSMVHMVSFHHCLLCLIAGVSSLRGCFLSFLSPNRMPGTHGLFSRAA